jgi:hypothetical protein
MHLVWRGYGFKDEAAMNDGEDHKENGEENSGIHLAGLQLGLEDLRCCFREIKGTLILSITHLLCRLKWIKNDVTLMAEGGAFELLRFDCLVQDLVRHSFDSLLRRRETPNRCYEQQL